MTESDLIAENDRLIAELIEIDREAEIVRLIDAADVTPYVCIPDAPHVRPCARTGDCFCGCGCGLYERCWAASDDEGI